MIHNIVFEFTVYQAAQPRVLVKLNSISKYYIDENHISAASVQKRIPRIRTGGTRGLKGHNKKAFSFKVQRATITCDITNIRL